MSGPRACKPAYAVHGCRGWVLRRGIRIRAMLAGCTGPLGRFSGNIDSSAPAKTPKLAAVGGWRLAQCNSARVGFMGGGAHPQGRGTGGGRIALGENRPPNARLPGCTGCRDRGRRGGAERAHRGGSYNGPQRSIGWLLLGARRAFVLLTFGWLD
jgi:hypothetical protein